MKRGIVLTTLLLTFAISAWATDFKRTRYRAMLGSGEVSCARTAGATYDAGMSDGRITVSANALRVEQVCSASIETPTYVGDYYPLDADNTRGLLLITASADETVLLTMNAHDDGSPATVVDVDNISSMTSPKIRAARCQDDGSWLMWVSRAFTAVYDGTNDCEVYRSTNAGSSWSLVHANSHGGPPGSGPNIYASGGVVIYGDYKELAIAGAHHGWKVFYSEDYGLNWDEIFTRTDPEVADNLFHCHGAALDPLDSDVVWAYYGDTDTDPNPNKYPPVVKLTKPSGWQAGDGAWTTALESNEQIESQVDGFHPLGSGEWLVSGQFAWIWTPASGQLEEVWTPPRRYEATANYKYYYGSRVDWVRAFYEHNGTLYMPVSHYTSNETNQNTNLAVSSDGRHWTTINQLAGTTRGWKAIHCYFDGYLWAYSEQANPGGTTYLYKIPPISAKTVQAIRVDKPYTNQLAAREDSTFTTAGEAADLGNWSNLGAGFGWGTVEAAAGGSDDSGHGWHGITAGADKDNSCNITLQSQMATPLANGDYVVFACDIWRGTNYSFNYEYFNIIENEANLDWTPIGGFSPTKRKRTLHCGKCTGVPTPTNKWFLSHGAPTDGQAVAWDEYIDCAVLYTSTTHWPTWAAFQPSGTAGTTEVVTIPLGGLGTSWSIAFDYQGGNSLELVTDHPICCLHGAGGDYIDLEFVAGSEKYRITDQGATSATLANAARRRWNDLVRVVITCDGTDTELHIYDAASGEQTIGDGVGVLMDNGPPSHLRLAINNDQSATGQGLFWGFKRWNKTLSAAEITAHWAVPGEGVASRAIGK